MAIGRERIERRLEELKAQQRQAEANLNALSGAIIDLEYLLREDSEESEKKDQENGE